MHQLHGLIPSNFFQLQTSIPLRFFILSKIHQISLRFAVNRSNDAYFARFKKGSWLVSGGATSASTFHPSDATSIMGQNRWITDATTGCTSVVALTVYSPMLSHIGLKSRSNRVMIVKDMPESVEECKVEFYSKLKHIDSGSSVTPQCGLAQKVQGQSHSHCKLLLVWSG